MISLGSIDFANNPKAMDTMLDTGYLDTHLQSYKCRNFRHNHPQGSLGDDYSIVQIKGVSHVCVDIYSLRLEEFE